MPDTSTEIKIATTTLGSAATSITLSSIPSTYTDLRVVISNLTCSSAFAEVFRAQLNADAGTNYSATTLEGNGGTIQSYNQSNLTYWRVNMDNGVPQTIPMFATLDIMNYSGSTNKTALGTYSQDQNGSGWTGRNVLLWRNIAAVNSIKLYFTGININAGTTVTLYGIL